MKYLIKFFLFTFAFPVFADYAILIDAGSSGSRAHVFEYQRNHENYLPFLKDLYSKQTTLKLTDFKENQEKAEKDFKELLDATIQESVLHTLSPKEMNKVEIAIFATAGMRLLPKNEQHKIYQTIGKFLDAKYDFALNLDNLRTISGKEEAVFEWLDVNYLQNNLEAGKTAEDTVGTIGMGGASTQMVFATNYAKVDEKDLQIIKINNQEYRLFAHSFLKLGANQAQKSISNLPNVGSCYPVGYKLPWGATGNYNFKDCNALYSHAIENILLHDLPKTIPPPSQGTKFVAFAAIYHDFKFFDLLSEPTHFNLVLKTGEICTKSWEELSAEFKKDKYLSSHCANASYFDELLYNTYGLNDSQLIVANKFNGIEIDWTLGALLYSLIGNKKT